MSMEPSRCDVSASGRETIPPCGPQASHSGGDVHYCIEVGILAEAQGQGPEAQDPEAESSAGSGSGTIAPTTIAPLAQQPAP